MLLVSLGCGSQEGGGAASDVLERGASGLDARPENHGCVAGLVAALAATLSDLDCFDADDPTLPGPALVPYDVTAPLWTDHAHKQRWLAIPDGTAITVDPEGHFVMPEGSVLLKNFVRDGQRLETRVWMNHTDAGWVGHSYRWNADGGDAVLAATAGEDIALGGGLEPWEIPSRSECVQCHEPGPAQNLGLQLTQLDREFTYPTTGRTANQLDTFVALGLLKLEDAMRPTDASPKLVDYRDDSQSLDDRARSYLHANCSSCHKRTDGYCTGDFRIGASGAAVGVCDVPAVHVDASWGWPNDIKIVAPGNPEQSALWLRLSAPPGTEMAMPPLGRHEVDQQGVELIAAWITSMNGCQE
jgi:uncharacterized repeat protein (TIGR03806 family)